MGDIFVPSGQSLPAGPLTSPPCRHLCYSPAQLKAAYDWPTDKHAPTGAGQTIVVAVAFGSPTIEADLASFNTAFDLPPATISYCGAPNLGGGGMWGPETSAGIEYAHAMAPDANLVLVISPTDDFGDMAATEASCLPQYPGAIVLQSFGQDEIDALADPAVAAAFASLHQTYVSVTKSGGTVIAASGDFGATGIDCFFGDVPCSPVAEYPASDPLVTAVGGTEGNPYPDGLLRQVPGGGNDGNQGQPEKPVKPEVPQPAKPAKPVKTKLKFGLKDATSTVYGGEQVWNESQTPVGLATGGAPSVLYTTPDYQQGFNNSGWRTTSDVAYDAAGFGGEAIIWNGILGGFGGTSIGPTHWGAIVALANELRASRQRDSIGQLNPSLYAIAGDAGKYARDFHDITVGNNSEIDLSGVANQGFDAGPGYDMPTGLGTPDVANLISDLANGNSKHDDEGDGDRRDKVNHIDLARGHNKLHVG